MLLTRDIIQKIINKNDRVLCAFYREFHSLVYSFFYRQIEKKDIAEELTQDTLYDFIEALRDFRGESSYKTYLFSIARNKVADYMKKKKLKQVFFSALPTGFIENIKMVFLDDEVERRELARRIEQVFSCLPNDYSLVLRLKYLEGERVQEIAKVLALSFKATESLLFRARKAFIHTFHIYK